VTGRLLLVPAPLDFGCNAQVTLDQSMPLATLQAAAGLQFWICENAKTTRAYLKRVGEYAPLTAPLQSLQLTELPREVHKRGDHDGLFDARHLLQPALDGNDVGLVSEAGMPAIADPGSSVVRAAHTLGVPVIPLVGPISILLGLAASGLNGQSFAFVGYIPATPAERVKKIRELESTALNSGQTHILIETPYRNIALLQSLVSTLQPTTRLAISSGLTLSTAANFSGTVEVWRQRGWTVSADVPAIFCVGR
jgi:16S rRNA (cytidine1402-2'-O)-methyltransferase